MSYSTRAYAFYGCNVPRDLWADNHVWAEADRTQDVLSANRAELPDVGYLTAGPYDNDFLFLTGHVTPGEHAEVELGEFLVFEAANSQRLMQLTVQLRRAVELLGYDLASVPAPAYIVVPDYS